MVTKTLVDFYLFTTSDYLSQNLPHSYSEIFNTKEELIEELENGDYNDDLENDNIRIFACQIQDGSDNWGPLKIKGRALDYDFETRSTVTLED